MRAAPASLAALAGVIPMAARLTPFMAERTSSGIPGRTARTSTLVLMKTVECNQQHIDSQLDLGEAHSARSGDHFEGHGIRHARRRRCTQRYGELHARFNLAGNGNAAADQRHGVCGESAAQGVTARARRQRVNGSVLREFDRAVLSCIRTTRYSLRKLNLGANHRDEEVVSRLASKVMGLTIISKRWLSQHQLRSLSASQLGQRLPMPRMRSSSPRTDRDSMAFSPRPGLAVAKGGCVGCEPCKTDSWK